MKQTRVAVCSALLTFLFLSLSLSGAAAQNGPGLSLVNEFSLGDSCPISGVVNAEGTAVWALIKNCLSNENLVGLQAFSLADGSLVGETEPFPTGISTNDIYGYDQPLTRGADGGLTVDLVDTYTTMSSDSFTVDPATGAVTPVSDSPRILTADDILAALPDFAGYTDYLTYSPDRSLALTLDDAAFYVFDVASGENLLRLEPPGGIEYAGAEFGPNNDHLYVYQMAEPGNYDNPAGTLHIFDIPSGEPIAQSEYSYSIYAVSPDERLAVVSTIPCCDHMSLAVLDLETGALSESLPTQTSTMTLNTCKNDGRSNEFGWRSDDPIMVGIQWLPDGSGFVTLHSETFNAGPNPCYTNDSRMRVYAVGGS